MKKIFGIIAILISAQIVSSQSTSLQFAKDIFSLKIKDSDFRDGQIFLTLDTIDASNPNIPSTYLKSEDPAEIIKEYVKFMKSTQFETGMFSYGELVNSPFFESSLHVIFFVNSSTNTYRFDLWTAKENTSKLEGITVCKYLYKIKPTALVN